MCEAGWQIAIVMRIKVFGGAPSNVTRGTCSEEISRYKEIVGSEQEAGICS